MAGWLVGRLVGRLFGWLVGWLVAWLSDWLTCLSGGTCRKPGWLADCLAAWLAGWTHPVPKWPVRRLGGQQRADWLAGWMGGRLADWLIGVPGVEPCAHLVDDAPRDAWRAEHAPALPEALQEAAVVAVVGDPLGR
eukprot:359667-Chlamydomonas_euryale.AAC.3